ncbi:MAG TPA: MFS transporter, partial [Candidatus Sulfopaludibacter sp.]|nr:MFS transporter [Candidatus Sulfopaludibacter sp.]
MSKSEARGTRLLTTAACGGMFVFGIVMALVGAIVPPLSGRLRFAVTDIGSLFLVMNFAMLVCSLALGVAIDRFGMKPPLTIGPLLAAGALYLIIRAAAFADLYLAVALLGLGGGALNGAANTLVSDLHDDPRRKGGALNLLGIFFGFGALFLPFAIGALLARFTLSALLAAAMALAAGSAGFAAFLSFPTPKERHSLPVAAVPRLLKMPLLAVFAALLFFESGAEFTLGGFITTYLTGDLRIHSIAAASWILAAYWAALMLSRAVLSRVALKADPFRILLACAAGAFAGAALAAAAPGAAAAAFAIPLTGFSLAGVYPAVLGIAGARFETHSGTAFGILFTVALTGGMIVPWSAAHVAGAFGMRSAFALI